MFSLQGVGGSVQYPKDYLKRAFDLVHSKGGVCISDEVQTGFGRTGEHYWGFEAHGIRPDIGNPHRLPSSLSRAMQELILSLCSVLSDYGQRHR